MAELQVEKPKEEIVLNEDPIEEPESLDADRQLANGQESEAEETEEPESQPDPQRPPRGYVPQQALHAERIARQRIQQALEQERRANEHKLGRMQGNLEQLNRRIDDFRRPQVEEKVEPEPDPDKDPRGWVQYQFAQRDKKIDAVLKRNEQLEAMFQEKEREFSGQFERVNQETQAQRQDQLVRSTLARDEDQFRSETPDYDEAIEHLETVRDRQLEAMGYEDPIQRKQLIANEISQSARQLYSQNRSLAEAAYKMAQATGWNGNKEPQPNPKLEQIRRGQSVARSMSSAPGSVPKGGIRSLDELANMTAAELDKVVPDMAAFKRMHQL